MHPRPCAAACRPWLPSFLTGTLGRLLMAGLGREGGRGQKVENESCYSQIDVQSKCLLLAKAAPGWRSGQPASELERSTSPVAVSGFKLRFKRINAAVSGDRMHACRAAGWELHACREIAL
jgi:hypothetical protein